MNILRSINPLLFMKKCKVIHNAVDFQKWKVKTDYVPRIHGKLKLVIAASHSYQKNLYGLVEAVNMLTDKEKSQLDIEWYGDRIEEPYFDGSFKEAQAQIKRYKLESIFHFSPATHNLAQIYQNSDAIGLFSKHEGLPNVICEGMACAKPVICTGISDLPILLSHQSNLLSAPSDIDSIKKSISYLLTLNDDDLKNIGNTNRSIAEKYFNRNNNILAYLALMNP
jgi:glycosyltransferase involved in cell wall biosynthesis